MAAYNPDDKKVVIVAMNTNSDDLCWEFDLSDFDVDTSKMQIIRTSGDINGENLVSVTDTCNTTVDGKTFKSFIKGSSITTFVIG